MQDFLKITGQRQTFLSTKYRKQTFLFANASASPHNYQMAAPKINMIQCLLMDL